MLENFLQKNNIYFTFVSFNIGLADTLYKIDSLYSLGEYLGFNYAFRQLKAQRTSASIMDDLGINDALRNSTQITEDIRNSCNYFELVLPDTLIRQSSSIQTIKEFIFSEIKPAINRDNRDLFLFLKSFYNRKGALLHLRQLLRNAGVSTTFLRDKIKPIKHYHLARKTRKKVRQKKDNKIKILIHIRRGDTYCFQLSDRTLISAWGPFNVVPNKPVKVNSLAQCPYYQINNQAYLDIIEGLADQFGASKLKLMIASDGHDRGIQRIMQFSEDLNLSITQIDEIKTLGKLLDRQIKSDFSQYDSEFFIGESNYNLLHTIDSIIESDIIISPIAGFASGIHEYFAKINASKIIVGNNLLPFYLSNIDSCQHKFLTWKRKKNYQFQVLNWLCKYIKNSFNY